MKTITEFFNQFVLDGDNIRIHHDRICGTPSVEFILYNMNCKSNVIITRLKDEFNLSADMFGTSNCFTFSETEIKNLDK